MTFQATAIVQDVSEQTEGDLAPVDVLCQLQGEDGNPIVGGELRLQITPGAGLQLPSQGDRVSLNGWFSYDDGSRSEAASSEAAPANEPSASS
jgi:hypothetical protein